MIEQGEFHSAVDLYAAILHNTRHERLPTGYPPPQPPESWPEENVALLERYLAWLYADNASTTSIHDFYLPAAGHVLGYHLHHHAKLDLKSGLGRVMDYFRARGLGQRWLEMGKHALHRFRRFMHEERGYADLPETLKKTNRISRYQEPLPDWLVEQLRQMQQLRQQNWRQTRLEEAIVNFWAIHTRVWRWLRARYEIQEIQDIQRSYLFAYIDDRLAAGYSVGTVNLAVRAFQATLRFLQEREYDIPQTLLRQMNLKAPDSLPRFLTDEQVGRLQAELERCIQAADNPAEKRNVLLDRALFYLLWQGGLRVCEAEDMRLQDLDLSQGQLAVRSSKGKKDRMVYLTERTCTVLQEYLAVRGTSATDLVFLYRHEPLAKDFLRNHIKAAGEAGRGKGDTTPAKVYLCHPTRQWRMPHHDDPGVDGT